MMSDDYYNSELSFADYQEAAEQTAIYPSAHRTTYPILGLAGEVGELCNKYKKTIRDNKAISQAEMAGELGDILWYLSAVATDFGIGLDWIANENLKKLASRKDRGVLGGSGDNR